MKPTRILLLLSLPLLLAACGFQLRGDADLPEEMAKTHMAVDDPYSTLARRVQTMLEQSGVQFVGPSLATALLEIPEFRVLTDVLSSAEKARGREYRVSHTILLRLKDA